MTVYNIMDSYTGLWPYDHKEVAEGLYVLKPVYEPIYTVNNLYNAFIVLFFLRFYVKFGTIYRLH